MKKNITLRTDFCDELLIKEHRDEALSYVVKNVNNCQMTHIKVKRKDNDLNKEMGDYITVDFDDIHDATQRQGIIECLSTCFTLLLEENRKKVERILVIGLGNREVMCDALGPKSVDDVLVTSHLYEQNRTELLKGTRNVATLSPGVMGQTGLESASVVHSISTLFKADLIIIVDALATTSLSRINKAIQMNNVGITPGGGVSNHRMELTPHTLGCPIIAMGVATVTSIGAMLKEALSNIKQEGLFDEISQHMDYDLIVTPKNMDDILYYLSMIMAQSINEFVHPSFHSL